MFTYLNQQTIANLTRILTQTLIPAQVTNPVLERLLSNVSVKMWHTTTKSDRQLHPTLDPAQVVAVDRTELQNVRLVREATLAL